MKTRQDCIAKYRSIRDTLPEDYKQAWYKLVETNKLQAFKAGMGWSWFYNHLDTMHEEVEDDIHADAWMEHQQDMIDSGEAAYRAATHPDLWGMW